MILHHPPPSLHLCTTLPPAQPLATTPSRIAEFGKEIQSSSEIDSVRNPWYELVYSSASSSISSGGPLRGALFWLWDGTYTNAGTGVQVTSSEDTITVGGV